MVQPGEQYAGATADWRPGAAAAREDAGPATDETTGAVDPDVAGSADGGYRDVGATGADRRVTSFVTAWARAIAGTSFVPGGRLRTHAVLRDTVERLAVALTAEPYDATTGYQIGADLVAANLSAPQTLGRSITLLDTDLLPVLGIGAADAPRRLGALLGAMAAGFADALRRYALANQEAIRRSELASRNKIQQELFAAQRRLQHDALHDRLTGLPNRAALIKHIHKVLAGPAPPARLGVCVVRLDEFKTVTGSFGPAAADDLLRAVARRLRRVAADGGWYLAHLGADEFALVSEGTVDTDSMIKVADRALHALIGSFRIRGHRLSVTGRAGIVEQAAARSDPAEMLRAADITTGWAQTDRRRWVVFDADRNALDLARYQLTAAMPAALAGGEFVLYYQPLVRLADGIPTGAEALARWRHRTRGLLGPDHFIALAEDTGLIVPLGLHLLRHACAQAAAWQADRPFLISVNLAVAQLRHPGIVGAVAAVLDHSGLPPHQLQLEITESAILDDGVLGTVRALAALGVKLAIDDFGTGYSALAYLADLPLHTIKLAAHFLSRLWVAESARPADETILRRLIDLGHDLGLTVVAEGVETDHQARRLAALGCDLGQGFRLGRPVPPAEMMRFVGAGDAAVSPATDTTAAAT